MKYHPGWASHIPVLIKVMSLTSGPVLELGVGPNSTPLLHWLCFVAGRKLVSYESDKSWYDMHRHFKGPFHEVHYVEDWNKIDIDNHAWSLAFVDQKPAGRRREDVKRLANNSQFVVVHDTQPEDDKFYGMKKPFSLYKFRYDYNKIKPWTSVLSNFVDVKNLMEDK